MTGAQTDSGLNSIHVISRVIDGAVGGGVEACADTGRGGQERKG